jgi:hypothetical protein
MHRRANNRPTAAMLVAADSLDVFVHRDHHWQLVAGQSSRICDLPPRA